MKVNKSVETPEGTLVFEGELNQQELDYVLSAGLTLLAKFGAIGMNTSVEEVLIKDGANFPEPDENTPVQ